MAEEKKLKRTLTFITFFMILLAIVFVTNPPDVKSVILSYIVLLGVALLIYRTRDRGLKKALIPLSFKNAFNTKPGGFGRSLAWSLSIVTILFFLLKFAPGFSLGLPILPGAISDNLRFFIIVLVAPIVEEIIFRGAMLPFFLRTNFGMKSPNRALILQASLFALAHLGAYITGIYDYPGFTQGLSAVFANISSFLVAGGFGYLVGFIVLKPKVRNLAFAIILHMGLNLIVLNVFTIIF